LTLRDVPKSPETFARQRLEYGVAHAQKPVPLDVVARRNALPDLGERHGREIEHGVRGEQLEVRHRLVRRGHHVIDLVGFTRQHRRVPIELGSVRHGAGGRMPFECTRQPLDGSQAPGDPG
jgi:hypothetical protein